MKSAKTCPYCKQDFQPSHGRQFYCPDKDCRYQAKLARQTAEYQIGDDAKKAIQKNYEIFTYLFGEDQQNEFDILKLERLGFDQFGYYGVSKDKNNMYYKVNCFYFWFSNPQKVSIWKKS